MPLPFVVPKNFKKTHVVKDEDSGITLEIPKYGSLTWAEYVFLVTEDKKLVTAETPLIIYRAEIVVSFLKFRFNLPWESTNEEVLATPSGEPLPETMVTAIYDFFSNELSRWKPVEAIEEKKESVEP